MTNIIKGIWRFIKPVKTYWFRYPFKLFGAYIRFIKSWNEYKRKGGALSFRYVAPILNFKQNDIQSGGGQYFYQDIWALRKLSSIKPDMHYDIGSRFDGFVGQATAICPVTCVDIRPPAFSLPDFHFLQGDILQLPFSPNSLSSLSCLHTIEHIGLGRYGDEINPDGFKNALSELERVILPGGTLLLSMPVGEERIEFNAQRVLHPLTCINLLSECKLIEFSIVNDANEFISNVPPDMYGNSKYSCGLYLFQKKNHVKIQNAQNGY